MNLIQKATGFYPEMDQKGLGGTSKVSAYFDALDIFDRKYIRRGQFYGKFIVRKVVKQIRQLGMMSYKVEDIEKFVRETPGIFSLDPRKRGEKEGWVYASLHYFPLWLKELDKLPIRPEKKEGKNIQTRHTVIDFDDMVRMPCIHSLAEKYFAGRDTALVDESQDMNAYQIHLVTQLCKIGIRIVCCGDRLQAIYAFRGAFMDSMDRMKNTASAHELPLSVTYRSRQAIVDFVNQEIPESTMIAHKDGGEVVTTFKEGFIENVVNHDVRMIVGARNKSLVECWITLAKNKISSSLKGSGIVKEIRDIIHDIKPDSIEQLCLKLRESIEDATMVDENGEVTYKISESQIDLMVAIPELIETYNIHSLAALNEILAEMEQDSVREIHTVHSAKGLEAPVHLHERVWVTAGIGLRLLLSHQLLRRGRYRKVNRYPQVQTVIVPVDARTLGRGATGFPCLPLSGKQHDRSPSPGTSSVSATTPAKRLHYEKGVWTMPRRGIPSRLLWTAGSSRQWTIAARRSRGKSSRVMSYMDGPSASSHPRLLRQGGTADCLRVRRARLRGIRAVPPAPACPSPRGSARYCRCYP